MKATSPVLPNVTITGTKEVVLAKDQPEYLPLPALPVTYGDGTKSIITRYRLNWKERVRLLFSGNLWLEQITFGLPLQPQRPTVYEPWNPRHEGKEEVA